MSDKQTDLCFIDSNVWLYAFIKSDAPDKTRDAKHIISVSIPVVSTQVVNEVCVNLLKKAKFSEAQLSELIASFYADYQVLELSRGILLSASQLRTQYSLSFWDSIIVSSALNAGVSVLYSEDMQDGLLVRNQLKIVNPFR